MKKITKVTQFSLDRLNNAEFTRFINNFIKLIYEAGEGDLPGTGKELGIDAADLTQLEEDMATMTDLVSQSRISDITAKLKEMDKERISLLVHINEAVRFNKNSRVAALKEAGTSLYNVLKPYIGCQKISKPELTSSINGAITDLNKPENAPHVLKLGIGDLLEELSTVNTNYDTLAMQRNKQRKDTKLEPSKSVRARMNEMYDCMVQCAYARNIDNGTEVSATFISHLNSLIAETLAHHNQRMAQLKRNATNEETDTPQA